MDEKADICVIVLSNLDYTTGYAVREFFFAICSLDIEHTEEKLNKEKTVSEVGAWGGFRNTEISQS